MEGRNIGNLKFTSGGSFHGRRTKKIFGIRLIPEFWYSMLHSYEYRTKNLRAKIKIFVKSPEQKNHSEKMPNKILA